MNLREYIEQQSNFHRDNQETPGVNWDTLRRLGAIQQLQDLVKRINRGEIEMELTTKDICDLENEMVRHYAYEDEPFVGKVKIS